MASGQKTNSDKEQKSQASPFVKWVGGKRSIISELEKYLPESFGEYYEPFVGGGALFFQIHEKLEKAHLSDLNLDLVLAYSVIKRDPQKLVELLQGHKDKHNSEYYYEVRSMHTLKDPVQRVARFLYLNKTCFNGLYRVNKKGEFNVPVGRYKNPGIVQEDNIRSCNAALQKADIRYESYREIVPSSGDFVYCDPPYHPVNSASFTSYTKLNFSESDQIGLRDFALGLHKQGVFVMLSNSNTEFIQDLYSNPIFTVRIVHAPRFVNCKPGGRDNVEEVLITTYG